MNMNYGKNGLDLTKGFEKCRLLPYKDGGGVWTNGWGNTHRVTPGVAITQDQADKDLLANVQDAVDCVNDSVSVKLTQDQFDALVDFTFNAGCGAFKGSRRPRPGGALWLAARQRWVGSNCIIFSSQFNGSI